MKPIKPTVKRIDPLKLKTSRKVGSNARSIDSSCPYCLSRLVVEKGKLKCSAERLTMWTSEFKLFSNLSEQTQFNYLKNVTDPDKFLELFRKWENNDLDCIYNNKFYNPIGHLREEISDPMVVGRVEDSLDRSLTDEEKAGESPIWTDGKNYFDRYEKGMILFRIPKITFPDDV